MRAGILGPLTRAEMNAKPAQFMDDLGLIMQALAEVHEARAQLRAGG